MELTKKEQEFSNQLCEDFFLKLKALADEKEYKKPIASFYLNKKGEIFNIKKPPFHIAINPLEKTVITKCGQLIFKDKKAPGEIIKNNNVIWEGTLINSEDSLIKALEYSNNDLVSFIYINSKEGIDKFAQDESSLFTTFLRLVLYAVEHDLIR